MMGDGAFSYLVGFLMTNLSHKWFFYGICGADLIILALVAKINIYLASEKSALDLKYSVEMKAIQSEVGS